MFYSLCALIILMSLLQVFQQALPSYAITDFLEYSKSALMNGEFWRIWTGHFVHSNGYHTLMNVAALIVLLFLFNKSWPLSKKQTTNKKIDLESSNNFNKKQQGIEFITVCLSAMLFISAGLFYFVLSIEYYVGFSGVLHSLFLYYFIVRIKEDPIASSLAITAIIVKVLWEQTPWSSQENTATLIETHVAVQAHLLGAIYGIFAGLCSQTLTGARKISETSTHRHSHPNKRQ